ATNSPLSGSGLRATAWCSPSSGSTSRCSACCHTSVAGRGTSARGGAADNDDEPLAPADDWRLPEDEDLSREFDALKPQHAGTDQPVHDSLHDDALERELASLTARPGDDPYELEWP